MKNKNHSNFNIDTLKLLTVEDIFQKSVADLRKMIGIPDKGFEKKEDFDKWYNKLLDKSFLSDKPLKTKKAVSDTPYFRLVNGIKTIMKEYGLTEDFYQPLLHYVRFNEIGMLFAGNYMLEWDDKTFKSSEPIIIKLKIYRKLSGKEFVQMNKMIKELQNMYLPAHRNRPTRPIKDIDKYIESVSLMKARGVSEEKIYRSYYLELLRGKYEKGVVSEKELLEAEKLNKDAVKIKKHKRTSKTIAKDIFGTTKKSATVRKIKERIEKEQKKRFKKV